MSALNTMVGGSHYKSGTIQPVVFFHNNPQLSFGSCNIIKYAYRHKQKNGLQDLLKVIHYSLLEAELNYGDDKESFDEFKKEAKTFFE